MAKKSARADTGSSTTTKIVNVTEESSKTAREKAQFEAANRHGALNPQGLIDDTVEGYQFELTPEMEKYLSFKEAAGLVTRLDTEEEQHIFIKEFNSWIKAGRPRPKMPKVVVEDDPVPVALYRIKHRGQQKLYYFDSKGGVHGKKEEPFIRTEKRMDATTGEEWDEVVERRPGIAYTMNYTKELGEKLLKDSLARAYSTKCYFIDGIDDRNIITYSVNVDDFLAPELEPIFEAHMQKRYHIRSSLGLMERHEKKIDGPLDDRIGGGV